MQQREQAELSRQWMREALLSIMRTKSFQEISVREITERAGVSRQTFYRHFDTKEQILTVRSKRMIDGHCRAMEDKRERTDFPFLFNRFFVDWDENQELYKLEHRDRLLRSSFERCSVPLLDGISLFAPLTYTQKRFFTGGVYSLLLDWIDDKTRIDRAEAVYIGMELIYGREETKRIQEDPSLLRAIAVLEDTRHFDGKKYSLPRPEGHQPPSLTQ